MKFLQIFFMFFISHIAYAQDDPQPSDDHQEKWISQISITKAHSFSVLVYFHRETIAVNGLRIYDRRSGRLTQEFLNLEGDTVNHPKGSLVATVDANFDGHLDLAIPQSSGGAGPNSSKFFLLHNPLTKRFELNKALSELSQVRINKNRTISSFGRGSCCDYSETRYRFIKGELVEIYLRHVHGSDGVLTTTIGRRVRGKMKYIIYSKKMPRH